MNIKPQPEIFEVSLSNTADTGGFKIPFNKIGGEIRSSMWKIDEQIFVYLLCAKEMKVSTPYIAIHHGLYTREGELISSHEVNRDELVSLYETPKGFYPSQPGRAGMVAYLHRLSTSSN